MSGDRSWEVEHHRGDAATFHDRPVEEGTGRSVWWFEVERPTVVLGSTQQRDVVDLDRLERSGVELARRRSGGGAVWLAPGDATWVDLVIPARDPLWDDDVSRSSRWVAEAWVRCLESLGIQGARPHDGAMVEGRWSRLVCFAGLAPGEVTVDGRKVVGVSQRRTRSSARFQCAVLHRWHPGPLLDVLALSDPDRERALADLGPMAGAVHIASSAAIHDALMAALPD